MDYSSALLDETRALGELIGRADQTAPVPTCPGWTFKHLFRHVGRGNRWSAQIIAEQRTEALDPRTVRDGKPPDDLDAAIHWLDAGAQAILDAVDDVGADTGGVDVHRSPPGGMVDPAAVARSDRAPRRRRAGAGRRLLVVARVGGRRYRRVDRTGRHRG